MTTQVPNSMLAGPIGGAGGQTVTLAGTSLTITSANNSTYNGNVLECTNAAAVTVTINAGAALTSGLSIVQKGAGLVGVAAGASVSFGTPVNGASTNGPTSAIAIIPDSTDTYTVIAPQTRDAFVDLGTVGASVTLDFAKYAAVKLTLSANLTITFTGAITGYHFGMRIDVVQDASHTVTFSPTPKTPAGAAYTMTTGAGKRDTLSATTVDGGTTVDVYIGGQDVH